MASKTVCVRAIITDTSNV